MIVFQINMALTSTSYLLFSTDILEPPAKMSKFLDKHKSSTFLAFIEKIDFHEIEKQKGEEIG